MQGGRGCLLYQLTYVRMEIAGRSDRGITKRKEYDLFAHNSLRFKIQQNFFEYKHFQWNKSKPRIKYRYILTSISFRKPNIYVFALPRGLGGAHIYVFALSRALGEADIYVFAFSRALGRVRIYVFAISKTSGGSHIPIRYFPSGFSTTPRLRFPSILMVIGVSKRTWRRYSVSSTAGRALRKASSNQPSPLKGFTVK